MSGGNNTNAADPHAEDTERFLARHEDLLEFDPVNDTRQGARTAYSRTREGARSAWKRYVQWPLAVRVIVALLFGIALVVVVPLVGFALYSVWHIDVQRRRLVHALSVSTGAVLATGVTYYLLL